MIARWHGSGGGKSLLLTGHTDTVSVENMAGDPFGGRIEGDRMYGRGTVDMKGGLAAILGAVGALRSGAFRPSGDLWLGFVTDEEYISIGTDALVAVIRPDAAILTEPTGCDICVAHKGYAWLTLTTQGQAAHGSLYTEGIDAIAHMGRVLNTLEAMEAADSRTHPLLGRPSVHASLIGGGLGLSTYPDACRLQIEHRLLPDESAVDLLARWQDILARLSRDDPRFSGEVTLDFERPGYEIAPDAPIVRALHNAYTRLQGVAPKYMGLWAWLDSAILGRAGVPTVIFGPGGDGAHAAVEYVNLSDVFTCAAVIAEAAANWLA